MSQLKSQQRVLVSNTLSLTLTEQRSLIAENKEYLREQQRIIDQTIEEGNNAILQLTREADKLLNDIESYKAEIVLLRQKIDEKVSELIRIDGV